jgi:arylsulfatase A-like enzyme
MNGKTVWAVGIGLTLLLWPLSSQASGTSRPPNILFIYADDQRYDALGVVQREQGEAGRFPWLQTPNLDRFANSGLRFKNSFVVHSLCSPSRANMLTSTYSHITGVKDNHLELPEGNITLGEMMREAGYTTGYFGKWHMGAQITRPGFDQWASQAGHGTYNDCTINVNGKKTPTQGWIDDVITDYAIKFIHEQKSAAKPFFAVIGYKAPHGPYDSRRGDGNDTKAYEKVVARPVPNLNRLPSYFTELKPVKADQQAQKTREYFRLLDSLDRVLGRLQDALESEGVAGNTIVIYASDNGYNLGEHGLDNKLMANEESMRIPLIIRWPGVTKPGTTTQAMVNNLDVAPTCLAAAGAAIPPRLQGLSLVPILRDPTASVRSHFFYESYPEGKYPTLYAVRTADKKLIHYPDKPECDELFDLQADRYEINNLFHNREHATTRNELTRLLRAEAERLGLPPGALDATGAENQEKKP